MAGPGALCLDFRVIEEALFCKRLHATLWVPGSNAVAGAVAGWPGRMHGQVHEARKG
jgi:hypothetical protein